MDYNPEHLIVKYLTNELSEVERLELDKYLSNEKNKKFFEELIDKRFLRSEIDEQQRIAKDMEAAKAKARQLATVGAPVFMMGRKSGVIKWMAAASVVAVLGVGAWVYLKPEKKNEVPVVAKSQAERFKNDVAPGTNGAILELADGSKIVLDNASNGKLAQQGNTSITKNGSEIVYNAKGREGKVLINKMSTPRGKYFSLSLPDGSVVWLNAESSITYPAAFVGKERKVDITGEAYFEVKKDASKPFVVSTSGAEVEVLGTHFNISSYNDESVMKTTLLEGAVKIRKGSSTATLKPGNQSQITGSNLRVVEHADVDQAIAWKNGDFDFKNEEIESIMRKIARWYDIEFEYKGNVTKNYNVLMSRNVPLSNLL